MNASRDTIGLVNKKLAKGYAMNGRKPSVGILKDIEQMASIMKQMGQGILNDRQVQRVMQKGAQPAVDAIQNEYNLIDTPDGDVNIIFDAKSSRRRVNVVYVGPNKKSKGYQLAHLLEYGSVARYMKRGLRAGHITQKTMQPYAGPPHFTPYKGKYTGIMPAGGFIRRGLAMSEKAVIAQMEIEFDAYLTKKFKELSK